MGTQKTHKKSVQPSNPPITYRVLSAVFHHESNTFSIRPTDNNAFKKVSASAAITAYRKTNTELAGFLDANRAYGWRHEHAISAKAGPGGKVTRLAFDWLCEPITSAIKNGDFDGILLSLHGAMVTDLYEDGEGELLRRIREITGPELPIAVTLDPHANVSAQMYALANIMISYKTYPHIDMREIGRRAADLLQRTMAGEIKPRTILARPPFPMLEEANSGRTDVGPMIARMTAAREWEQLPTVGDVSINAAFPADINEVGPTVLVTCWGDYDQHQKFAQEIADDIWDKRYEVINEYISVEETAEIAAAYGAAKEPLLIADYADNPGAGAYGDSTNLLQALLDAGVTNACFGPMVDGDTATKMHTHKIGDRINIKLGGKTAPEFGGGPLDLEAELILVSNGIFTGDGPILGGQTMSFGKTAVLRVQGIEILVVTNPLQMRDLQQFKTFGINPADKDIIAIKSMQHFLAAFGPLAGEILICDSGALCSPDLSKLPYKNVPEGTFPLETPHP